MCQNDVGNIAGPRTGGNQGPRNEMRQRVEEEDEENGCHLDEAATPPGDFPWVVTHVAMLGGKCEPFNACASVHKVFSISLVCFVPDF